MTEEIKNDNNSSDLHEAYILTMAERMLKADYPDFFLNASEKERQAEVNKRYDSARLCVALMSKKYREGVKAGVSYVGLDNDKIQKNVVSYLVASGLMKNTFKTKEQKKNCKTVIEKYGRCLRCGSTHNLTIDHILPLSKGGGWEIDNLQPLCSKCNNNKGTDEVDYRHKGKVKEDAIQNRINELSKKV